MQITEHVHMLKVPFELPLPPQMGGGFLNRFVNIFILIDDGVWLIDTGVKNTAGVIDAYLKTLGKTLSDITAIIFTHSHPDHMGGAQGILEKCSARTICHRDAKDLIESTELQFQTRPVPGFHAIVEGPVNIDAVVTGDGMLQVGKNLTMRFFHTPGHCPDSISLFINQDKALITADLLPVSGEMPIYEDAGASRGSISKLQKETSPEVLLSSWSGPFRGKNESAKALENGLDFLADFQITAEKAAAALGSSEPGVVARKIIDMTGLPPFADNPLFHRTVAAHLKEL